MKNVALNDIARKNNTTIGKNRIWRATIINYIKGFSSIDHNANSLKKKIKKSYT